MIDQVTQRRRVMLGVRAPRVAVLLNSSATWDERLVLVEILTGIWGGTTFAVIPTDGQIISPLFWRLLKLHDPDWFVVFPCSKVSPQLQLQLARHATTDSPEQMIHRLGHDIGHPLTPRPEALRAWRPASPGAVHAISIDGDDLSRLLVLSTAGALSDLMRTELARLSVEVQQVILVIGAPTGVYATTNELWAPVHRWTWVRVRGDRRFRASLPR